VILAWCCASLGPAITLSLMGIEDGHNQYLQCLLSLDQCRLGHLMLIGPVGPTPLQMTALLPLLYCHPDQSFAAYIYNGITGGFRIGFNRAFQLRSATKTTHHRQRIGQL
jgi:hypothetical protein